MSSKIFNRNNFQGDDAEIDEKIKKVVEDQSEKILSQVHPIQTSQKIAENSKSESATKPKDKVI